jgi:uncharacterized protein with PQ loop repeat
MDLVSILSLLATISTILTFASPFSEVMKAKALNSTRGQSFLPFICMWTNCCLWGLYGAKIGVGVVILVNGIGCMCSVYFIYVWLHITKGAQRVQLVLSMLAAGGFISWMALYSNGFVGIPSEYDLLPWCASSASVIMFGSPLIVTVRRYLLFNWNTKFLNNPELTEITGKSDERKECRLFKSKIVDHGNYMHKRLGWVSNEALQRKD